VIHYPFLNLTEYRRFLVKFLSICSGIEAASVAWEPLGWEAAAFSEIEPFPSAVLAHHYPDVPNLGDMLTLPERIRGGEAPAPDLLCGGTPCQAFSVAGNRRSLDDARGNLSLTFCEIANAIDDVRAGRSEPACIVFWENVPGVLNTADNAFGCFLGELAGESVPLVAAGGKWTNAGYVSGPKRAIAWRVLDAQYFGVAQRRRRVFLVASARDGFNPAEILFEREGVRRDSAPSRETGQEVAGTIAARFGISRNNHEECVATGVKERRNQSHWDGDFPHPTLNQSAKGSGGVGSSNQEIFSQRGAYLAPTVIGNVEGGAATTLSSREYKGLSCGRDGMTSAAVVYEPVAFTETADCLTAAYGTKWNGNASATNGSLFVAQPFSIMPMNSGKDYKARETDISQPLMAGGPVGGNQAGDFILQAIPIHDQATRFAGKRGDKQDGKGNGLGIGEPGAPMNTLTKGDRHAVAHPTVLMDQGGSVMSVMEDGTVGTLRRETHGHEPVVMHPVAPTLTAFNIAPGKGALKDDIHITDATVTKTLDASGSNPAMHQGGAAIIQSMAVRRLTPVECERLQGFPDDYTNIPWRKQPTSPDGPRYKALGNSWAVPNVRWIGARIDNYLKGEVK
jgi:DNA (cytosine-5)-methyltransferase 1